MRVSIRVSILTIFLTLLLVTGILITSINYFSAHKTLMTTAQTLFRQSNELILTKAGNHLLPLANRADFAVNLIATKVVNPDNDDQFRQFLYFVIKDYPQMVSAYYGDKKGNFYIIKRSGDNYLVLKMIRNGGSIDTEEAYMDSHGKITKEFTAINNESYDPRKRSWYISAATEKRLIWTNIYLFPQLAEIPETFGITSAAPVYSNQGELLGVFGADVQLDDLDQFLDNLEISKKALILIVDSNGNLISSGKSREKLDNINTYYIDGIKRAFKKFKEKKQTMFYGDYDGRSYLVSFAEFNIIKNVTYTTMVAAPVNDILGGLQRGLVVAFASVLVILLLNIIIIVLFSKKLSEPIIRLAKEAIKIKDLHLDPIQWQKTYISEIFTMQTAFSAMIGALNSFVRYVPFALVKGLLNSGEVAHIGGKAEEVTLLFSDITDFTALSEPMQPKQVTFFLSEYFEEMTTAIQEFSGTLDKYIGDGIMAFWGAPQKDKKHALHACQCALISLEKLKQLNEKWRQQGKPEIKIRIGINTGKVVVGNVGSHDRLSYTAIGDGVNLASRLQTLNKLYGAEIIVSDYTYQVVKDDFQFRMLDFVAVRGKRQSCYIYQLLNAKVKPDDLELYNKNFKEAFDAYAHAKWDLAAQLFSQMKPLYPDDKLSSVYLERCHDFKENPPKNWKGEWISND